MMRLLLLLTLLVPLLAQAAEPEVRVRSQLLPADSALVGGTLSLQVDLLVDTWFSSAPQLPRLSLDGAVVSEPSSEAQHLNEQIDGKPFFGLRYTYQITPQRAQAFEIPALAIQVQPGQGSGVLTVHSQPLHFVARQPAGAEAANDQRLVARQLVFTQELQPSHQPLRVGDSVTRRLQIRAEGAQAMLIPAPDFAEVDGLKRYVQTPTVGPLSDGRGGVSGGVRSDSATYVVTEAGRFSLPAIEVHWWDASSGEAQTTRVPALELQAQGAASYRAPFSISDDLRALGHRAQLHIAGHWLLALLGLALLGALVYLGRNWGGPLLDAWRNWRRARRQAWLDSADYAWKRVPTELSAAPPQLGALYLWLRRATGCREMNSAFRSISVAQREPLLAFLSTRYGRGRQESESAELMKTLTALHRSVDQRERERNPAGQGALKPLNP